MSTAKLDAQPRDLQAGKPKQLRRTGMVPVIVYGKTQAPVLLQVAERPLAHSPEEEERQGDERDDTRQPQ